MTNFTKILIPFLIGFILIGCTVINPSMPTTAKIDTTIPTTVTPIAPITYYRNGRLEFYFATAQKDVASNAQEQSQEILKAVKIGKRLGVSGFINPTQDLPANSGLAKDRVASVKQFLLANGVPETQISLVKPTVTESTEGALFRRVDVYVLPNRTPLVEPISTTLSEPTTFFENGRIKFYFAKGRIDLADNALEKSQAMIQATKQGKLLGVQGYMSDEYNETISRELMKKRAEAVKAFLIKNGVPADHIQLVKPDLNAVSYGNRVEVFVLRE